MSAPAAAIGPIADLYALAARLGEVAEEAADRAAAQLERVAALDGLPAALIELADAEANIARHFAEFGHAPWEEQPEPVRADWSRCCRRKDAAVKRLAVLGRALKAAE